MGLLPVALLSFVFLLQTANQRREQLIDSTEEALQGLLAAFHAELQMSFSALDVLAASPRMLERDLAGLHREARELLRRRPNWTSIALADPNNGQQLLNSAVPFGAEPPPRLDLSIAAHARGSADAYVGNLFYGPVLQTHGFGVRVSVTDGAGEKYILAAGIRPSSILEILHRQPLPERATAMMLDAEHTVVARTQAHEEWLGKSPPATLLHLLTTHPQGAWATLKTPEGESAYTTFARSEETGWSVAIAIPVELLDGPVARSYLVLGGSILGSILLGLAAAFVTGRTITRPMRALEDAAAAVARGEMPTVPETGLLEVKQAAMALATAHTEREKLLHSEREARRLAEDASRAKDEFLAMLGHELRNPLAAITSAAAVLEREERAICKETLQEAKAVIRRQANHLGRLTDDLLDAGRVMKGKIVLQLQPVDLVVLVESVITTLRNSGRLSEHTIDLQLDSVWVNADPPRIDQVVANLLTNAIKYTPAGGRLTVCVARQDTQALFVVRDTGVGLEADLLPRVFDLFVQGERTLERSQGGLGIGLTLVQRLVELHGGQVEAHSEGPGCGSQFSVRLPAIEAPALAPSATDDVAPQSCNIAIVEDNDDVRAGLKFLLTVEGHQVYEASNGRAGVELILRERVDVALIDVGLPLLDGYGVAKEIRARAEFPVRLIAMTGYGSAQDVERGMRAGFDHYLTKPIDLDRLTGVLLKR